MFHTLPCNFVPQNVCKINIVEGKARILHIHHLQAIKDELSSKRQISSKMKKVVIQCDLWKYVPPSFKVDVHAQNDFFFSWWEVSGTFITELFMHWNFLGQTHWYAKSSYSQVSRVYVLRGWMLSKRHFFGTTLNFVIYL